MKLHSFYSDTRIPESITILRKKFYFAIPKKIVMYNPQNEMFVIIRTKRHFP